MLSDDRTMRAMMNSPNVLMNDSSATTARIGATRRRMIVQ
ncbi:Uncharacterised protein [Mycobacteroides abscessus]|nr:Uncharacterised protein [Mycobacteroides abscessus]